MDSIISNSPEATAALGVEWGKKADAGCLIGLSGDLGAGKTQFVKGLARGLGINSRISSPTFGLVNEVEGGRLPFWHIDLYRLNSWNEIVGAGIDEYLLSSNGLVVVEWIERWLDDDLAKSYFKQGPGLRRLVRIDILSEGQRRISYEDSCD